MPVVVQWHPRSRTLRRLAAHRLNAGCSPSGDLATRRSSNPSNLQDWEVTRELLRWDLLGWAPVLEARRVRLHAEPMAPSTSRRRVRGGGRGLPRPRGEGSHWRGARRRFVAGDGRSADRVGGPPRPRRSVLAPGQPRYRAAAASLPPDAATRPAPAPKLGRLPGVRTGCPGAARLGVLVVRRAAWRRRRYGAR